MISNIPSKETYKPSILLVEDDFLVHKIHCKRLEFFGFRVDSAINGKDAFATFRNYTENNTYDLILLDWGLPDISGIDVCKKIRNYERQNQLPRSTIVMITAYVKNVESEQICIEAGVDRVVTKPIIDNEAWESFLNLIKK